MQVFKACLKIIQKNAVSMLIYIGIFMFFVIMITMLNPQSREADFTTSKPRTAIFNDDAGNIVSDALADYIAANTSVIQIEDNREKLQDALFLRQIVYIVRIPDGFGEKVLNNQENVQLERTSLPDSFQGVYADQLIDRYLNAVARYAKLAPETGIGTIIDQVESDLSTTSKVTKMSGNENDGFVPIIYYFIFLAYSLIAVMILGVTSLMLSFQNRDIQKRNAAAPVSSLAFNGQLLLGNLVFGLIIWIILSAASILFFNNLGNFKSWLLLVLNTLIFTLTCLSMSFLISQFIKSRAAQQAAANVIALGTCFISGAFVPQEMLGQNVLDAASFTPTYWYIRAVRLVQQHDAIPLLQINNFTRSLLIQVAFMLTFVAVALVIAKYRHQNNS
jgi:ABC-2 type transport system permease protein